MMLTNWGYTLTGVDALPDMLTEDEFNAFTGGKYVGDERIASALKSAQTAVRNYVGWHLAGSLECAFTDHILRENGRMKRNMQDLDIQLPAKFVSDISSIKIGNDTVDNYVYSTGGMLTVFDVPELDRKTEISVEYTAGLPDSMLDVIKEVLSGRVTHALAQSYGITSEAAGGVSVTYNSNWTNGGGAYGLITPEEAALGPYKLQGVF